MAPHEPDDDRRALALFDALSEQLPADREAALAIGHRRPSLLGRGLDREFTPQELRDLVEAYDGEVAASGNDWGGARIELRLPAPQSRSQT